MITNRSVLMILTKLFGFHLLTIFAISHDIVVSSIDIIISWFKYSNLKPIKKYHDRDEKFRSFEIM